MAALAVVAAAATSAAAGGAGAVPGSASPSPGPGAGSPPAAPCDPHDLAFVAVVKLGVSGPSQVYLANRSSRSCVVPTQVAVTSSSIRVERRGMTGQVIVHRGRSLRFTLTPAAGCAGGVGNVPIRVRLAKGFVAGGAVLNTSPHCTYTASGYREAATPPGTGGGRKG